MTIRLLFQCQTELGNHTMLQISQQSERIHSFVANGFVDFLKWWSSSCVASVCVVVAVVVVRRRARARNRDFFSARGTRLFFVDRSRFSVRRPLTRSKASHQQKQVNHEPSLWYATTTRKRSPHSQHTRKGRNHPTCTNNHHHLATPCSAYHSGVLSYSSHTWRSRIATLKTCK